MVPGARRQVRDGLGILGGTECCLIYRIGDFIGETEERGRKQDMKTDKKNR